jgi:hypothetical protein
LGAGLPAQAERIIVAPGALLNGLTSGMHAMSGMAAALVQGDEDR